MSRERQAKLKIVSLINRWYLTKSVESKNEDTVSVGTNGMVETVLWRPSKFSLYKHF